MKLVKSGLALLLAVLLLCFCACTGSGDNDPASTGSSDATGNDAADSMSCEQIIAYVYENMTKTKFITQLEGSENRLVNTKVPSDNTQYYNYKYYFGVELDFIEAVASEPEMQPPAYSFCVAKMKDGTDMKKTAQAVKDNADPIKWGCIGVSTVYTEYTGNVLMLIMADKDTADAVLAAFRTLTGSQPDNTSASAGSQAGTGENFAEGTDEKSMLEIIDNIYKAAPKSWHANNPDSMTGGTETAEGLRVHSNVTVDFELAVYSVPVMTPDPFYLCILKMPESLDKSSDMDKIRAAITDNADLAWQVCMTAEKAVCVNNGQYIMFLMCSSDEAALLTDAFLSLDIG